MDVGTILLWEDRTADFRSRIANVESLGYRALGIGDSPTVYRELMAGLAVASMATSDLALCSMVMVPVGRHPAVVASALSTLQELSGDRLSVGIGTGGSGTAGLGQGPTTLSVLKRFVDAVRLLLAGQPVEWEGETVPPPRFPRPVRFYLSAYGPAARRLAGETFDGVILATGSSVPLIEHFLGEVGEAAESAGRSASDVDVWVMSRAAVREDREEALTDIRANLASAASFGLRSTAQMATVPEEFRPKVVELQQRYDATQHTLWDGDNARLVAELGLSEYLAGRFAVAGTPDECRRQAEGMAAAGVSRLMIPAVDRDPDGLLERFAKAVIR
jgi:5,10-methylenetetrahydromethanopterin reductase